MARVVDFYGYQFDFNPKDGAASLEEMLKVFEYIKPKPCSLPFRRIGGTTDGAYLVPDDLEGVAACFSPGVFNRKTFEDTLLDDYGIPSHMCDYTSDAEKFKTPLRGGQTFLKKWLDPNPHDDNISLDHWVKDYCPEGDLVLQMDIEGAEFKNIINTGEETLAKFRVIVIEIHNLSEMTKQPVLDSVVAPFFEKLAKFFTCVHAHPNNCCGHFTIPGTGIQIPKVLELTLIRSDRLSADGRPPMLPHPLDIGRNVAEKPPLFLSDDWLDGERPIESQLRMINDRLDFHESSLIEATRKSSQLSLDLLTKGLDTLTRAARANSPVETDALNEVAAGCAYRLSSARSGGSLTGVVAPGDPFFFHTRVTPGAFIEIDLGEVRDIRRIVVTNCGHRQTDRAAHLFAVLSPDHDQREDVFPMRPSERFLKGTDRLCVLDIPSTPARFVKITSPIQTALHFANVEVFVPR